MSTTSRETIAIINGPNMNLLGIREPSVYCTRTWDEIETDLLQLSDELCINLNFFQSNWEGQIVDYIQSQMNIISGIVINPAALTKTGYSIVEAIKAVNIPYIEVHMTNIFSRGGWHADSIFSENAIGCIFGMQEFGYELGIKAMIYYVRKCNRETISN